MAPAPVRLLPTTLALMYLAVGPGLSPDAHGMERGDRAAQLLRYEVLRSTDRLTDGLQRHRAVGIFDAPPDDVFRVATSYGAYSEYMPRITESRVAWQGRDAMVRVVADLPWPMDNMWVEARYQHDHPTPDTYRIRFTMVRGSPLRYEGTLLVEPCPAIKGKSMVTYELVTRLESGLPRAWLEGAVGKGVANFVHYLRGRVNRLQRQGTLHLQQGARLGPQQAVALVAAKR